MTSPPLVLEVSYKFPRLKHAAPVFFKRRPIDQAVFPYCESIPPCCFGVILLNPFSTIVHHGKVIQHMSTTLLSRHIVQSDCFLKSLLHAFADMIHESESGLRVLIAGLIVVRPRLGPCGCVFGVKSDISGTFSWAGHKDPHHPARMARPSGTSQRWPRS